MLRLSFQSTIVSHNTVPMLVSKWQYHVIDDIWSFERHAVLEGKDSWFEKIGTSHNPCLTLHWLGFVCVCVCVHLFGIQ